MLLPRWLTVAILLVVTGVWVTDYGAQFVIAEWHYDPTIGGIFMGTVGATLMLGRKGRPRDGNGDEAPSRLANAMRELVDPAERPARPRARHGGSHRPAPATTRRATDDEGNDQ